MHTATSGGAPGFFYARCALLAKDLQQPKTMMNLPSLRHLWHLTAPHDHGHFGRAAEACHVTQGARGSSTLGRGLVEADARERRGLAIADASN